ncbi:hypothetical protein J6590_021446 [Homalodisca vitripennis]|nr:hypothetical protein J6590_021446 [Homalodisca vitripennis]
MLPSCCRNAICLAIGPLDTRTRTHALHLLAVLTTCIQEGRNSSQSVSTDSGELRQKRAKSYRLYYGEPVPVVARRTEPKWAKSQRRQQSSRGQRDVYSTTFLVRSFTFHLHLASCDMICHTTPLLSGLQ